MSTQCRNCAFAHNLATAPGENLQCRRYPPCGTPPSQPKVPATNWCGEFKAKAVALDIKIREDAPMGQALTNQIEKQLAIEEKKNGEPLPKVRNKRA